MGIRGQQSCIAKRCVGTLIQRQSPFFSLLTSAVSQLQLDVGLDDGGGGDDDVDAYEIEDMDLGERQ